jgi:transposase
MVVEDLNDDCLGRALDWLYAHDPTTLFAGIALRARRAFGIRARQVHVDTTSFTVTGEYAAESGDVADVDAQTIAVAYGYSRDHRADLKQWMLAPATTRQGDVPLFCQALDGNASYKVSLVAAVEALAAQLRAAAEAEEGEADLLHIRHGPAPAVALVERLQPLHQQVLALLGPSYEEFYKSAN